MTSKVNSKTFILTPIAQNATHLPTEFTQLDDEASNSETMHFIFLLPCIAVSVAEWTHKKCLLT